MNTAVEMYDRLVARDIRTVETDDGLEHLGTLIDLSWDLRRIDGLHRALEWGETLALRPLNNRQSGLLHYFLSNAWANKRGLPRAMARAEAATDLERVEGAAWDWEQVETEKQIHHLRLALQPQYFDALPEIHKCNVTTNLANLYDTVGRFVEAIEYWDQTLRLDSSFGMALGNKGIGLRHYAHALYDPGHRVMLLRSAFVCLDRALQADLYPEAAAAFSREAKEIGSVLERTSTDHEVDMWEHSLGGSAEERKYRELCLEERLFLNPLNDLGAYPIAAHDVLSAPSIVYGLSESPYYHGCFDQMKQEYVSARFLCFEGMKASRPHYSDRGVLLYNSLDYPVYCLAIEKVKAAYRVLYSLFDKIAFFLNAYLDLGIPERRVSFRTLWYEQERDSNGLRPKFAGRSNLPLRGLFWLSKDLFEDKPGFKDSTAPDAQLLTNIRNHLEHRYLRIRDDYVVGHSSHRDANERLSTMSLGRQEFQAKTVRLLKLVRAAMIYLSLTVHREEQRRASESDTDGIIVSSFFDTWEDEWKF